MTRHPIDSTALIFGLLFAIAGTAILLDETVAGVNTPAVTGTIVGVLGLVFVVVLIQRQLREGSEPPTVDSADTPLE